MCGQPFGLSGTDVSGPSLHALSAFRGSSLRTASALEHITLANTLDVKHVATGKEEAGSAVSPTKKAAEQQREVSSQHG